ncbi:pyridoxine biosynthesis protein [Metarhizium rileyi]|uniref:Pyridoxine biosynthesis protein n=1 Tax=Metarhizium rileyi (strain RCEF 4871) TaxID=1649241 RepID=A0A5C6G973_METRR|nr:pyridoxine biosynthesis protein [Metarhizium rileyi]
MPALSPTMTEGNIATWKVKEGQNFSAGDVLLEIETDKATMDVEAQEDGIIMKIMSQDGAKSVQVGTRIAVLAEAGDDIKTLEIPQDEQQQQGGGDSAVTPEGDSAVPERQTKPTPRASTGESHEQKHPLMPSVEHLVKQHGLSKDDVSRITPTGPSGRLLKGDVLAYLGSISTDSPAAVSSRFEALSHLDLSNIKVAEKKAAPPANAPKKAKQPEPLPLEVNVPVSLDKVIQVQNRIQETLGVFMPLSTFISRAAEVANDNLPPTKRAPTASELFDQVLGLDKVKAAKGTRGVYLPQISAVPPSTLLKPPARPARKVDIIDILTAKPKKTVREHGIPTVPGFSNGLNVFSLVVPREEVHRAHMFLERCKAILEEEPGRLVL